MSDIDDARHADLQARAAAGEAGMRQPLRIAELESEVERLQKLTEPCREIVRFFTPVPDHEFYDADEWEDIEQFVESYPSLKQNLAKIREFGGTKDGDD